MRVAAVWNLRFRGLIEEPELQTKLLTDEHHYVYEGRKVNTIDFCYTYVLYRIEVSLPLFSNISPLVILAEQARKQSVFYSYPATSLSATTTSGILFTFGTASC